MNDENISKEEVEKMSVGKQIQNIRKENNLTQEELGQIFHVTRQTISNWENEKSYPDLQTLVTISDMFCISLDKILKEDNKMVRMIDKERIQGNFIKRQKNIMDFFTGAGTGILISCIIAPDSYNRTITFLVGLAMVMIGWYKRAKCDKTIIEYLEMQESEK